MSKTIPSLTRLPSALTQLIAQSPSTSTSPSSIIPKSPLTPTQFHQSHPSNLYETLASLPRDGVGSRVHQSRWASKGIRGCFWYVTRSQMKMVTIPKPGEVKDPRKGKKGKAKGTVKESEGVVESEKKMIHGKAWGYLVWRGKPISTKETPIPGGLKYKWSPGISPISSSALPGLPLVQNPPETLEQIIERVRASGDLPEGHETTVKANSNAKGKVAVGERWTWKERSKAKVEERQRIWNEAIESAKQPEQ